MKFTKAKVPNKMKTLVNVKTHVHLNFLINNQNVTLIQIKPENDEFV